MNQILVEFANPKIYTLFRAAGSGKGLQRGGKSRCGNLIDSNMAEAIWVKLSGTVEDICQKNLGKEFFGDIEK